MLSIFKNTGEVINQIEEFLNIVDESCLVFQNGVKNYLKNDHAGLEENLKMVDDMESRADELRRAVEDALYRHSLLPEFRSEVMHLLDRLDDLPDNAKENLMQFEVESPFIPGSIHDDFMELSEASVKAVEAVVLSARSFFRKPQSVKDQIHRVYYYEKEADRISNNIKKKVFKEINGLDLSQKNHIRHFVTQIEEFSDISEGIADDLSILAIKRSI